jgi:hypothetical protein
MHWGTIIWRSQSAFFMRDSVQSETMSGAALHSDSMPMAMHFVSIVWRSLIDFLMGASMHEVSMHFIIIMRSFIDFIVGAFIGMGLIG